MARLVAPEEPVPCAPVVATQNSGVGKTTAMPGTVAPG